MSTDRIDKQIFLPAPPSRVWRALADSSEFGAWFGMKLDGAFSPGETIRGHIVPTTADPDIAAAQKPYEGTPCELLIEQMEPERLFSFRWHPFAIEPGVDYSAEPMTLITFVLQPQADGVLLTVSETGFDRIPLERRAKAFAANEAGWGMVVGLVAKYLALHER